MKMSRKMLLVVGLGRFGESLCEKLVDMGQYVIGIDLDSEKVKQMADVLDLCAQLDATDEESLVKIGAKEADVAVVCIGESIEASILASTILKGLDIPLVVARAQNRLHARVLARVGVNKVIFPERDMGERLAEQFIHPWITNFSKLPGADFLVGEINPLPEMLGKNLAQLRFRSRYDAMVLLFNRSGAYFLPNSDTVVEEGDKLLIAGLKESMSKWLNDSLENNKGVGTN
ncbi:MAG: TrkA family potassium uptake protein [Synergistales bacterium]|nr:TrkA family potassium uptake protein [Synergistales bacterium]